MIRLAVAQDLETLSETTESAKNAQPRAHRKRQGAPMAVRLQNAILKCWCYSVMHTTSQHCPVGQHCLRNLIVVDVS